MSDNASSAGNQQERLVEFTPDYVVGLIDGEGYFSVTVSRDFSKTYKSLRMRLIFGVKLKEDDGEILHRLKQFFNCGSLHRRIDERPTFSNCLEYQVRRYEDIKTIIIPFFRRHPLLFKSKRYAFERFVELAACFEAGEHLSDQGFEKMKILAREVHR